MAEGEFPKRLQLPRILERRRAPAAFQLEATHGESGGEIEASDSPTNEADTRGHRGGETNTEATLSLREAKRQPPLPLDEIATVIQSLTYGEMIELSEAMWKNRPNGSAVTLKALGLLFLRRKVNCALLASMASNFEVKFVTSAEAS